MAVAVKRPGFSWMWVLLLSGLSLLSWISTYTGIMELIAASSGDIGIVPRIAVAFAVFMLQLMILYILDAMFSGHLRWWIWPLYIIGYFILFLISAGFAFGFYWKYLEAGNVTTSAAESSLQQVQQTMQLGATRLEQLQSTFTTLSAISAEKAEIERERGGTCLGSPPGDGPRRRLRDADAQRFQFANNYVAQRIEAVKTDMAEINGELQKIRLNDPSTIDPVTGSRNAFIGTLNRQLGLGATRFNALRTDPQLLQLRDEFATRAEQAAFPDDRGGTFRCPDPQLQTAINGVVRAINEMPELNPPLLRAYEGSEAVIEAFRRLTNSGITAWHRTTAGMRNLIAETGLITQAQPVRPTSDGLTERDYIPLTIAIFVDLCILMVSINRPFGPFFDLSRTMEAARRGTMNDYLETFYKVFQNEFDPDRRPTAADVIAPIQDVVFDHRGRYYAAVPLDFREEDYKEWLAKRTERSTAEEIYRATSERPLEVSRYITSVFATLEGNDFVKLTEAKDEGLDAATIKRKLDEQGSVYAQADAFRLYRFRQKAWAQILMQSVGSSAAVSEEAARRRAAAAAGWEPRRSAAPKSIPLTTVDPRIQRQKSIDEDVSGRPAITHQARSANEGGKPGKEGIDDDPDIDQYNTIDFNNNPKAQSDGDGATKPRGNRAEPEPASVGLVTWMRRWLGRD